MRTARGLFGVVLVALGCRLEHADSGRPPGEPTVADSLAGIEQDSSLNAQVMTVLRAYYARVSSRDWRGVRGAFWPGATITSQGEPGDRVTTQTVDQFIRHAPEGAAKLPIFSERVMHAHVTGYGNLADAWVVFEIRQGRTRDSLRTTRGIDAFHLYRDGGSWGIASLASAPEQRGRPLTPPVRRVTRRAAAAPD